MFVCLYQDTLSHIKRQRQKENQLNFFMFPVKLLTDLIKSLDIKMKEQDGFIGVEKRGTEWRKNIEVALRYYIQGSLCKMEVTLRHFSNKCYEN